MAHKSPRRESRARKTSAPFSPTVTNNGSVPPLNPASAANVPALPPWPEVLDTEKAADYLGVSPASLRTWKCTNAVRIPYVKIGNCVRYLRSSLDAYLAAQSSNQQTTGTE